MAKLTNEEYVTRLKNRYGDMYDYSMVNYTRLCDVVTLICPKHGLFEKKAETLLRGCGCDKCKDENKQLDYQKRAEKRKQTVLQKYGVDNVMKLESTKQNLRESMLDKYGVDNARKMQSTIDKARQTNVERYGAISYAKSEEGLQQIQNTMKEKYGAKNFMQSDARFAVLPEMKEKARQTQIEKYGASHYAKSDDFKAHLSERKKKEYATKLARGTFNTSRPEIKLRELLVDAFGENDVEEQYKSNKYPFYCDFYIHSLDLYIELNVHFTHGHRWYEPLNVDCINLLSEWESRSKCIEKAEYYKNAIETWTIRDVQKRNIARINNLNYLVFWDSELRDVLVWLQMGCPIGQDWDKMYSWLPERDLTYGKKHGLTGSVQSFTSVAKQYQWNVFYEQELKLWNENPVKRSLLLQMYLYYNRMQELGKLPYELSNDDILRAFKISGVYYSYSSFSTKLMDTVVKKYGISSIYDPCAGWGERLLYCYKNNISYFGVDINKKLKHGYEQMINDFNMIKQRMVIGDSSIYQLSGRVDAVLTCPPYGSLEQYSDDGAEIFSDEKFLLWWEDVVSNSLSVQPKYFCFQINENWCEKMVKVVESCGFEVVDRLEQETNRSHFGRTIKNMNKKFEIMVVLKRSEK